jgi:hypothetical protein
MKNPFKINPAVQLICDKVASLPWNEVHQTKLYEAWSDLTEHATRWEKRQLFKAEKISKASRNNAIYLKATQLVVSGDYTANRWGEEKIAPVNSGQLGVSAAVQQASAQYNEMLRQKYLGGQDLI